MSEKIRWGIIGCGGIAASFAKDMKFVENAVLTAAGSRTLEKAKTFAENFDIENAYGSYEELVKSDAVDAVYIATPHPMHYEDTMLCLENGKSVLCEKAFTLNTSQAEELVKKSREKKLFLMEAMWTRCIPATRKIKELIENGEIGQVLSFTADFGVKFEYDPKHRAFNPELGGGALLDLGVYPISFASLIFESQPKSIETVVKMGSTGVDFNEAISFLYENGGVACISSSLVVTTPRKAVICGTDGMIEIECPFFHARKFTLTKNGKQKVFDMGHDGIGYRFETEHASQCILDGKIESDLMPLNETIEIMRTMDAIREKWGLVYPQEKQQ